MRFKEQKTGSLEKIKITHTHLNTQSQAEGGEKNRLHRPPLDHKQHETDITDP